MKVGTQKQKGNRHQRSICEIFNKVYYSEGDGVFKNTPGSGGWDKQIAPGDIQPFCYKGKRLMSDELFPFSVECKDWKDQNVKHIFSGLYSKPSQIFVWVEQSTNDASFSGKIPIVIFKLYRTENVVLMNRSDWNKLQQTFGAFPGTIYKISGGPKHIVFVLLENFINWVDWGHYKKLDK